MISFKKNNGTTRSIRVRCISCDVLILSWGGFERQSFIGDATVMIHLSGDIAATLRRHNTLLSLRSVRLASILADKYTQQLLSIALRREAVKEEINGVVRVGEYVNEILRDVALTLLSTVEYEGDAVGQLREEEVEDGYEQHVENLTLFFRPLVDIETTRVRVQVAN
jgi:hypothetical protein